MKTATIEVFHVWGTMNTTGVQVKYRGKTLLTKTAKCSPNEILKFAQEWILRHGFTHMKVKYG